MLLCRSICRIDCEVALRLSTSSAAHKRPVRPALTAGERTDMLRHSQTGPHRITRLRVSLRRPSACQGHQKAAQCTQDMSQDAKALRRHRQMTGDLAAVIGVLILASHGMQMSQKSMLLSTSSAFSLQNQYRYFLTLCIRHPHLQGTHGLDSHIIWRCCAAAADLLNESRLCFSASCKAR